MANFNVVDNTKRNMTFGVLNKFVTLLCPFITRTIIQRVLGSEYLGLNSLFSSILTVLSLSELGIGSAIVYSMYKPVAENDTNTVCALLNFYRKVYDVIGIVILLVGLCLIPFLEFLISGSYPEDINLTVLYLIYLVNTVISYFMFAYMSSLIVVYQRDDINSRTNMLMSAFLYGSQIIILFTTANYYFFVLMMPIFTIANNLRIAYVVHKMFPEYSCRGKISNEMRADIKVRVGGAFISKVCQVTRNSLDSICISAFLGLTMTAMYNNYYYILNAIISLMAIFSTALQGGIGNHVVTKSIEDNYNELKLLDFAYMWVATWCSVCLLCLFQPFMQIWMGNEMILSFRVVVLFCLYFYFLKTGDMRSLYSTANGLWWHHRYRSLTEAASNIILNVILGYFFGIYGIVIATIISIISCNFFWGSQITFKQYFGIGRLTLYYKYQLKYFLTALFLCIVTYGCCRLIKISNDYLAFLLKILICIVIPNVLLYILYHRTDNFLYLKKAIFRK